MFASVGYLGTTLNYILGTGRFSFTGSMGSDLLWIFLEMFKFFLNPLLISSNVRDWKLCLQAFETGVGKLHPAD